MNKRVHATGGEMLLQSVAVGAENRENVPHGIAPQVERRRGDARVGNTTNERSSHLTAAGIVGIKVAQLHAEDSSLEFVNAAVATAILKHIFPR